MKTKLLTAIIALTLLSGATPSNAYQDRSLDVVFDAALVRPSCVIVTAAGSVLFVAILPFAAMSHSVKTTGHTLVGVPAHAAFTRPVGDFSSIEEN
jgi:hypothetical protein